MTTRQWMAVLGGLVLCGACRTTDPRIEILERELRIQEDIIFEQEEHLKRVHAALASCRQAYRSLQEQQGGGAPAELPPRPTRPSRDPQPRLPVEPPELEIEIPGLDNQSRRGAPRRAGPRSSPADEPAPLPPWPGEPAAALRPADRPSPRGSASPPSPRRGDAVDRITLNRLLTGGHNTSDQPGDEGVMVVVEPRDAAGNVIHALGDVEILVLDPGLPPGARQVAVWRFDAAEVGRFWKKTLLSEALHFDLAWPGDPPRHAEVAVRVAFHTADGRTLTATQDVQIDLPDRFHDDPLPPPATSWQDGQAPPASTPPAPRSAAAQPRQPLWRPYRR